MEKVDISGQNSITFSEFIVANLDMTQVLTPTNVIQAFNMLDKSGTGRIGPKELLQLLQERESVDENELARIVEEAAPIAKTFINFKEFQTLMNKLIDFQKPQTFIRQKSQLTRKFH
mmetsp:Transcript_33235/g.24416  ORF Transcript_33235/g.24416 Transcript_33235/m.24416 type:complete len:117 (+) Transcript_33235:1071-1421(+)